MVINRVDFPIYEIMVAFSVFIGAFYILISLKNDYVLSKKIILFFILFFICSILGGKLYTFVMYGFKHSFINSSLSAYGGLAGVFFASYLYEKIFFTDGKVIRYTTLSLPLIYSFTKIGCFFTGCCYGIPYEGIFSVTYPHVINRPLLPIQLIEVIIFFALFIFCNSNKNRKDIIYITFLSISIIKFFAEFLRFDQTSKFINPNQLFSVILFLTTLIIYYKNKWFFYPPHPPPLWVLVPTTVNTTSFVTPYTVRLPLLLVYL